LRANPRMGPNVLALGRLEMPERQIIQEQARAFLSRNCRMD